MVYDECHIINCSCCDWQKIALIDNNNLNKIQINFNKVLISEIIKRPTAHCWVLCRPTAKHDDFLLIVGEEALAESLHAQYLPPGPLRARCQFDGLQDGACFDAYKMLFRAG